MLETFISRTPFAYNIPSLDRLLQTKEIPSSFLLYDEQVLSVLIAAGIPAADAYVCLKAIKKKKADKVAPFKKLFKDGFSKHLQEDEGKTEKEAEKVCDQILKIIEDSASYLFNASHALCVACDSLYAAYLKAHYPYEFYLTALKIYDDKKNKDKISLLISEMKRYANITLTAGAFGQDNRDWLVDKEHHTISQSLSAIRFMSKGAAEDLYRLGQKEEVEMGIEYIQPKLNKKGKDEQKVIKAELKAAEMKHEAEEMSDAQLLAITERCNMQLNSLFLNDEYLETKYQEIHRTAKLDCFTNVLRALQFTSVKTNQIRILIELGYFSKFGKTGKLVKVYDEFQAKLKNDVKSFMPRLEAIREYEKSLPDEDLPIRERLQSEQENIGLCLSTDNVPNDVYFIREVDEKWGTKVVLYSVSSGKSGSVRFRKADIAKKPVANYQLIKITDGNRTPRYTYKEGRKVQIPGETEYWVKSYMVLRSA